jgi:hypothetical protein
MSGSFDGLVYEDSLPLGWAVRDSLPDGPELAGLNAENVEVLVADASLDEQRAVVEKKHDEDPALAEDLQRVEFKLNVLIQLVARLLKRSDGTPAARSFRMRGAGIEWRADGAEPRDGAGLVTLFVSRHFPQPLMLPGHFAGTHEDAHGRWARFEFAGLAPPVEELLARLIFRHHRRAIAGTRTHPRG